VLGIGVRAPYRGAGLGRRLIDAALADARQRGFERIELWVRSPNGTALRLYRAVGFVEEGRRRDAVRLDQGSEDEVLMALLWPARAAGAGPAGPIETAAPAAPRGNEPAARAAPPQEKR